MMQPRIVLKTSLGLQIPGPYRCVVVMNFRDRSGVLSCCDDSNMSSVSSVPSVPNGYLVLWDSAAAQKLCECVTNSETITSKS